MARDKDAARSLLSLACIAIAAIFAYELWLFSGHLIDDTFISLRYARNLAEGHGLVFNPGERVEGFTNPSFVVFAALCLRLGIDPIAATRAVSLIAAAFVLLLLRGLESMGPRAGERALAPYFAMAGPALAYWSVASFETIPFTALFLGALWLAWGEGLTGAGHRSTWLWLLLSWTRPEGPFLFAVSTIAFAAAEVFAGGDWRSVVRRHVINAALLIAGIAPLFAARWWYYGALVPNTFRAKVTGGAEQLLTGLRNVGQWAAAYPLHAAGLAAAVALVGGAMVSPGRRAAARRHPHAVALVAVAAVYAAYVAAVGGDFMPYFRFLQPLLALGSLFVTWLLALVAPARARAWLAVAALALTLAASHATTQRVVAFVSHRTTANGIRVGELFAAELEDDDWIAVNTAGAIPYYSRLAAIDMLGLTDAEIARRQTYIVSTGWAGHRRGWGRYVLDRRPKRILFYNTAGSREPFYLGDHELADSPFFRLAYTLRTSILPPQSGGQALAYFAGAPFGESARGVVRSPELGFYSRSAVGWPGFTTVHDAPLVVNSFDRDDRLDGVALPSRGAVADVDALVAEAITAWSRYPESTEDDPILRREVEALCADAQAAAQSGNLARAKDLLATAMERNRRLRSPLVYQYVANVAVLTGEPFVALAAQKEALRLQPDNQLYRRNLAALLVKPYEDLARPQK